MKTKALSKEVRDNVVEMSKSGLVAKKVKLLKYITGSKGNPEGAGKLFDRDCCIYP